MIIQATSEHLKSLFVLENELFSANDFPISRGSFYYHIKHNTLYIYIHEHKIVGYILWLKRKKYYRLYSLGVAKEFRSLGVAGALLEHSFKHLNAPVYTLEVKTTNSSAIGLYEKYGFTKQKILTKYYPGQIDGYFMKKQVSYEA